VVQIYQYIGHIVVMLLLLGCSAFFSGTETAFFSLSRRQISLFQQSTHKLQNLVASILSKPSRLLGCLLFGNMVVNVLFYATASIITIRVERNIGVTAAAVTAAVTFICLVLIGEMLPKSLAYANARYISVVTALPVFLCIKILAPLISIFRFSVVESTLRLLPGAAKSRKPITASELGVLIESSRRQGVITAYENRLLTEIMELGFLKVRHVMRPRVDMISRAVTDSSAIVCKTMQKNHFTKLPVYAGSIDNIIGLVHLRQILLEPDTLLDKLVQPVNFVPEQKTVESLLEFFRKSGSDTAIVVDEYGGIAGMVRLEDIAEELLGPIEITEEIKPIELMGPFEYRLAGNLAVHDWTEAFSIDPAETRISTIGGLVTALLGKVPKSGDVVYLKNLKFTVERMKKHRVETIILTLEPLPENE
jgi:CBS domain containing-hemolysin-like protein